MRWFSRKQWNAVSRAWLGSALFTVLIFGATAEPAKIDVRTAFKAGSEAVSHYLEEKYRQRYVDDFIQTRNRNPSEAEIESWRRLFVAKAIVTAHAREKGYFERPEVQDIVDRMERYMLTQPAGPFYEELYLEHREPEAPLETLYRRSFTTLDIQVAAFRQNRTATKLLGEDFSRLSTEEQTQRALRCRDADEADFHDGLFTWPYFAFGEIADDVESAAVGRWVKFDRPPFGTYYVNVRNVRKDPPGDFSAARDNFSAFVENQRRQLIQLRRRRELLTSALFSADHVGIRALGKRCAQLPRDASQIPLSEGRDGKAVLFRYQADSATIKVTAEAFIRHFNQRLVRKLPRDFREVREAVEDMAMEELDFRAARRRHIHRSAKFMEDRRGFTAARVLELFEREVLAPRISVGPAEMERYYRAHETDYRRTTKVGGRLVSFATFEEASAWLGNSASSAQPPALSARPSSTEDVEMEARRPWPGFEALQDMIFHGPVGTVVGPVLHGKSHVVFTKTSDLAAESIPLAEVADTIQAAVLRSALDARILELAEELAPHIHMEGDGEYEQHRFFGEKKIAEAK